MGLKYLGKIDAWHYNAFEFSTGRRIDPNIGAIGLTPDLNTITAGYDDSLWTDDEWIDPDHPERRWTQAERAELADYMIDLWQQWKAKHAGSI